jgi:ATP:ADP antiporter, AAA family
MSEPCRSRAQARRDRASRDQGGTFTAFVYFFFLMASYFILRPLRDTMGTVYGVAHLQELFTGTFLVELHRGAGLCRPCLAHPAGDLPALGLWLHRAHHGRVLFPVPGAEHDRWIAAAFYVWVSAPSIC